MAKLGEIKLIPSIEGKKRFSYSRNSVYMALGDEWRQDLDDFLATLHEFSHNKADLKIDLWTIEDPDFDRCEIEVTWRPTGLQRRDRFGNHRGATATLREFDEPYFYKNGVLQHPKGFG